MLTKKGTNSLEFQENFHGGFENNNMLLTFLKVTWRQKNFCSKSNSRHGPLDRASLEWLTRGLEKKFRGQPTEIFQKNVEISDMGFRVLPVFGRTPF